MRYKLESEDSRGFGTYWYVFDTIRGGMVGNGYMNKYMAQTELDRLNEIEEV